MSNWSILSPPVVLLRISVQPTEGYLSMFFKWDTDDTTCEKNGYENT